MGKRDKTSGVGGYRGTQGRKPLNGHSAERTQRITVSLTFDELCQLAALSPMKKNGKPNYSDGVRRLIMVASA